MADESQQEVDDWPSPSRQLGVDCVGFDLWFMKTLNSQQCFYLND